MRFGDFAIDPEERLLRRDGKRVELAGRYFDALLLMVREPGRLIGKERFNDEVWRGVPVTDEALTQCIRSLRRALGDKADAPRFIETVPKHGYRFIAPVDVAGDGATASASHPTRKGEVALIFAAGVVGAGLAGLLGGLAYGALATSGPAAAGQIGTMSTVLVLLCVTIFTALLGGAGVAAGLLLAAHFARGSLWPVVGAAFGGLVVGAAARMLGVDAFHLFSGHSPARITGGLEGMLLGAAVGAAWVAGALQQRSLPKVAGIGAGCGALAGAVIALAGGRLMAGSLLSLARTVPGSRIDLGTLSEFGSDRLIAALVTCAEGALFAAAMVAAMALAQRQLAER